MAQLFAGDGDKKSRFSGEGALKPVKPLRRECRSASAEPVCSCAFFLAQLCTRDRGCSAHPAFPAPSSFEGQPRKARATSCRENADAYPMFEIRIKFSTRHCEERKRRSNPSLIRCGFWIASLALAMTVMD